MSAWRDGWRRVLAAPALLAGVFVVTLLAALPLALTMGGLIEAHLGSSLMAADMADGVSWDWWQEFRSQATGLGTTFTPTIIGFAATLDNVSSLLDGPREIVLVAAAIATYLLAWLFLSGGILDRYARQAPTYAHGFFAAAGVFFWRLLRLAIVAGLVYGFLFTYVHDQLFDEWYVALTENLEVERTAFLWRVGLYTIFGALLVAANVVFDYAKVRLVVEERRSAIGALMASLRFIARNPGRVLGLYALNAAIFLLVIGLWAVVAPGAGGTGLSIWLGLFGSQGYVLARLAMKLHFMASAVALFGGVFRLKPEATAASFNSAPLR